MMKQRAVWWAETESARTVSQRGSSAVGEKAYGADMPVRGNQRSRDHVQIGRPIANAKASSFRAFIDF